MKGNRYGDTISQRESAIKRRNRKSNKEARDARRYNRKRTKGILHTKRA